MKKMQADDMKLVREFAKSGSEEAFAELVRRHVNLVYSAALRRLENPHEAEEVTQVVFIILARKAASLAEQTILSGWLYQTAQLSAANFLRAKMRRQHREHEAFMQFTEPSESHAWPRLCPFLDDAMSRLRPKERDAIVLRFFENRTVAEVAAALGVGEAAAQKRVNRATEKLRRFFAGRGIHVSAHGMLSSIGEHAVQIAPVDLLAVLTAGAVVKGATVASSSTLTLMKGTLKLMAWTKAKTAIVSGVVLALATSTAVTTAIVYQHHQSRTVVSRASWKFAGYRTPEAAFETAIWAMDRTNFQSYLASITTDGAFSRDAQGKTEDQVVTRNSIEIEGLTGYRIIDRKTVPPDKVVLTIQPEGTGHGANEAAKFVLQRVGTEWKLASTVPKGRNQPPTTPRLQLDPNRPTR